MRFLRTSVAVKKEDLYIYVISHVEGHHHNNKRYENNNKKTTARFW